VSLPGEQWTPRLFRAATEGPLNAPVSALKLTSGIGPVVDSAAALLGESEFTSWLRQSYRPGATLGESFAWLFARLFADWGVIFLDASDAELHALALPLYQAAIERAEELDAGLLNRGRELEAAGYHQQVKVTPASTLLFGLHDGARVVVHRRPNAGG